MNPFDLLGDNDNDDPSQLLESATAQLQKIAVKKTPTQVAQQPQQQKAAKLPTKPLPPTQAVREAKNDSQRGGGRGGGRGSGRGRGGYNRDYSNNENAFNSTGVTASQGDDGERERRPYAGPRGPYRGGRRDGFNNEEGRDGERPRRTYERRSGTGRGSEIKREGAGRGNWGAESDEVAPVTEEAGEQNEKKLNPENLPAVEDAADGIKEGQPDETEEKEPEEKEMTLEEYEKLLEEKRKALSALKAEERKVEVDKDFESMQQLINKKKDEDSVFIKLGSDKDKKKEAAEKEKVKKSVSINEFLKPAEGDRYGGRGRGRGRGPRGGGYGGGNRMFSTSAPAIEDPGEFPTLGGK